MPYKFNDARRAKIPKAKYRVTNWSACNESLRRHGDLTVWVTDDVAQNWAAAHRKSRGGQSQGPNTALDPRRHSTGCRPQAERLFANPNRQITAQPQALVLLRPVGHPMLLLRDLVTTIDVELVWHLRHPRANRPHPISVGRGSVQQRRYDIIVLAPVHKAWMHRFEVVLLIRTV